MTSEERQRGLRWGAQKRIAKELGVSETEVSRVIRDINPPQTAWGWEARRRVQVAVARELGVPVAEAFADTRQVRVIASTPVARAA